jgi:hypothetical protein
LKRGVNPGRFQRRRRGISGRREMTGGVHLAAREREGESNGSGRGFLGCGLDLELGQIGSRGSNSIFIFLSSFPFLISISFVSFAKRLQFNSNHFQKFSKIQNNHTEQ